MMPGVIPAIMSFSVRSLPMVTVLLTVDLITAGFSYSHVLSKKERRAVDEADRTFEVCYIDILLIELYLVANDGRRSCEQLED